MKPMELRLGTRANGFRLLRRWGGKKDDLESERELTGLSMVMTSMSVMVIPDGDDSRMEMKCGG